MEDGDAESGSHHQAKGIEQQRQRRRLDDERLVLDAMLGTGIRGGARGLIARVIGDAKDRLQDPSDFSSAVSGLFAQTSADVYEFYQKKLLRQSAMNCFGSLINK